MGEAVDEGTLKPNPGVRPEAMDITGTAGPVRGRTIPAIYERDGDTLRLCHDLSGKSRPKEFRTAEGTQLFLVTYRREERGAPHPEPAATFSPEGAAIASRSPRV